MNNIVECPKCSGKGCECACHDPEPLFENIDTMHPQFNVSNKDLEDLLDELDPE